MSHYYKTPDEKTSRLIALLLELISRAENQTPGALPVNATTEIDGAWYVAKPRHSDVCQDLSAVLDGVEIVELPEEEPTP
jgi:hypothetical protein